MPRVFLPGVVALCVACGSPLETGMDNLEACKLLYDAVATQCSGQGEFEFLNCDKLPGCPGGGNVEKVDVEACVTSIANAGTCDAAHNVECSIAKDGCATPSDDPFNPAVGRDTACTMLLDAVNGKCAGAEKDATICTTWLGCENGGAYKRADLETAVAAVEAVDVTDCDRAESELAKIQINQKFCFDSVVSD